MIDPLTAWLRLFRAAADMQATWIRAIVTVEASRHVVSARSARIGEAMASPWNIDVPEMARMVPEKVEALGLSGTSLTRDLLAMHRAWLSQAQRVGAIIMADRAPAANKAVAVASRNSEYLLDVVDAVAQLGKGAVDPVHKAVVSNRKRLRAKL